MNSRLAGSVLHDINHFRLVVVGGGAAGCGTVHKFGKRLGGAEAVCLVEPQAEHHYQPMWSLVGAGLKRLQQSVRPTASLLPSTVTWLQDSVSAFHPDSNQVVTEAGTVLEYDMLVVAIGLTLRFDKIRGLPMAFETPGVGSIYSKDYVEKTAKAIREFKGGNAIFTFPDSPVKCAGAPQKIMYLAEESWRRRGLLNRASIQYRSALSVLFGVKKYANALWEVVQARGIHVHLGQHLVEVRPETKEAVFQHVDTGELETVRYDMLHVTPPMSTPACLADNPQLADTAGFLTVDRHTLQHTRYPNIFGIGDCTDLPTAKTAAAVAAQLGILRQNLTAALAGKQPAASYDGYTSCPLITGRASCILAEFDYQLEPLETFPVNQAKERWLMYQLKAHLMPHLYWTGLVRGRWEGPAILRKLLHFGRR